MRCIPKYRVIYGGKAYEAGVEFRIEAKDAEEMRNHGVVLDEPAPPPAEPKRTGRPPKKKDGAESGQRIETATENG